MSEAKQHESKLLIYLFYQWLCEGSKTTRVHEKKKKKRERKEHGRLKKKKEKLGGGMGWGEEGTRGERLSYIYNCYMTPCMSPS